MTERSCAGAMCVLIDGLQPLVRPLASFLASEVESVEMHPRDQTGTIASRIGRMCTGFYNPTRFNGGIVIWMRRQQ